MANNPLTALETILVSIETIGLEPTAAILQNNLEKCRWKEEAQSAAEFVTEIVAKTMKMPVQEVRHGVLRRIDRRYAIGFCAYYLHDKFTYQMKIVSQLIRRSESLCYKYSKVIRDLKAESQVDKKYFQWRQLFDRKVKAFQSTQKITLP